jgi:hypothetical protein
MTAGGYRIAFIFAALLLLSGCSGMTFSPEQAVVQEVIQGRTGGSLKANPETIRVLQKLEADDRTFILVSFEGVGERGQTDACTYAYEAVRRAGSWSTGGGGGGCGPADLEDSAPIDMGSGTRSGPGYAYSYAYGLVRTPEITRVEVVWEDGQTQSEPVINGSYLAFRMGNAHVQNLVAYDAADNPVYDHTSLIAPEKQKACLLRMDRCS